MTQPAYDHPLIPKQIQVPSPKSPQPQPDSLDPMAPRTTPISKKAAAKKVVEEEIVDEEQEEEVEVEDEEETVEDVEDEVVEDDDEVEDEEDADEEDEEKPKKGSKSKTEPKKREVSSAVPKTLVDLVFANLKDAGEVSTTKKDIKAICDCFVKTLVAQVMEGEKVTLTNHMTFKRALRKERKHKTPKTGVEVTKPAHYVMTMEVKPDLKKKFVEVEIQDEEPKPKKVVNALAPKKEAAKKPVAKPVVAAKKAKK